MKPAREIRAIAHEILRIWNSIGAGVNYAAAPYLDAMLTLRSINDTYILDSGASVVRYFLANAGSFRGEDARRLKAELKSHLEAAA